MSMFNSLFKGGSEKGKKGKAKDVSAPAPQPKPVKPAAATPKAAPVAKPQQPRPAAPKAAPPPSHENPMDLDEMLSNILKIEDILGHGEGKGGDNAGSDSERIFSIYLMLKDMLRIMPTAFTDTEDLSQSEETCEVIIEDLFDKLSSGKVETTLGYFLASVPQHFLATDVDRSSNLPVLLPLPLVVEAIGPDELRKRTSVVDEEPSNVDLPDLFGANGLKIPAREPAAAPKPPQAVPTPPPAAPKPPQAAPTPPPAAPKPPQAAPTPPPATPKPPQAAPTPPPAAPKPPQAAPTPPPKPVEPAAPKISLKPESAKQPEPKPIEKAPEPKSTEAPLSGLRLKTTDKSEPLTDKAAPSPKTEIKEEPAKAPADSEIAEKEPLAAKKKVTSTKKAAMKKVEPKPVEKAPEPPPKAPEAPKPVEKAPEPPPKAPEAPKPVEKAPEPPPKAPEAPKPVEKAPEPPAKAPEAPKPVEKAPEPPPKAPEAPKPVEKAPEPPPKAPEAPKPVEKAPEPPPKAPEAPKPVEKAPETPKPVSTRPAEAQKSIHALVIQGVDVNTADVDELVKIAGLGQYMAKRLVEERQLNGSFFDIFDLARVPGIEYNVYEQITGSTWSEEMYREMRTANKVVGSIESGMPDVNLVAERFKMLEGFEGCIITHSDGDLLASSWDRNASDTLKAMGPQIIKRVKRYMEEINIGETLSVVVVMEGRSVSVVHVEDICFLGVHTIDGLSRKNMQIVHAVGLSLGHRFANMHGIK